MGKEKTEFEEQFVSKTEKTKNYGKSGLRKTRH